MYKLILQDYRSHWRSSLKRIWDNSTLCFVWLFYTIMSIGSHDEYELSYIFMAVPCVFAYMLARMYGGYLNKTFFLCPLDADARRKYAEQSFRLRIIIPSALFLIGNIALMLCGHFHFDIFLIRLFVYGCTAISVNIYCQPTNTADIFASRYPFVGNFETINTYSNLINVITIILITNMNEHSVTELVTLELVIIGMCMLLQLIATISKVKLFYWQSIVIMDFYEERSL